MTEHTPGPWEARGISVIDSNSDLVVNCVHGVSHDQDKTNARIISAAPDLLDVAEMILERHVYEMPESLKQAAKAAIAKARGKC